jgi:hypothetical protein
VQVIIVGQAFMQNPRRGMNKFDSGAPPDKWWKRA